MHPVRQGARGGPSLAEARVGRFTSPLQKRAVGGERGIRELFHSDLIDVLNRPRRRSVDRDMCP